MSANPSQPPPQTLRRGRRLRGASESSADAKPSPPATRRKRASAAQEENINPFGRARADHLQETAEDYVELIADLIASRGEARVTDMARRLGISIVTASKTVARLQKAGFVRSEPYRSVFLTETGESLAARCRERHKVVLEFLTRLGVPPDIAAQDTEGMEHHISDATLDRMRAFIAAENEPAGSLTSEG
jgi:DtxR family manganese transport transcriptional regulator